MLLTRLTLPEKRVPRTTSGARNFGVGGKIKNLCIIINIDKFSHFKNSSMNII